MQGDNAVEEGMKAQGPVLEPAGEHVYVFPVTFAQQRLLFLNQLDPTSTSYCVPWSIRMKGRLNVGALERTLNEIVCRHEILRTTFDVIEGQPVQIVSPAVHVPLALLDCSQRPDPEREARDVAATEAQTSVDLKNGPVLRTTLLRLGQDDHVLFLTMHHIVFDGWSRRILASELAAVYEAFCELRPSPLPELPLQYADYAVWQRNYLQGENLDKLLGYWKQELAGAPLTLDLPTDRPRPAVQSYRGAAQSFVFPQLLSDAVIQFSQRSGVTPYMTLLTAFQVLLSRYSGQNDILVGGVIANRNRSEIEGVIGYFANTLPLRTRLDGDPSFRDLLEQVKDTTLGAYAHQDMPFERLVEELRPDRSLSHNPLFQVLFSLQNAPQRAFELLGLQLQPLAGVAGTTSKFDISCFLQESRQGLSGRFEYNTDLFDATTIDRMLCHYQCLLEAALANPETRVSHLPILTAEERHRILVEWNATEADYPRQCCVHQLFEQQAERTPDAVACEFENQQLSYRGLNQRANQLAHFLQRRGIGAGQCVGIFVERSLDMMVGLLGIQKSGAAYVPLDPAYPAERLRLTLEDAQLPLLLTQQSLLASIPEHNAEVVCLDSDWERMSREDTADLETSVQPEDLIYVIFTSGSTGRPKGVQVPHRAVVNLLTCMGRELRMGPNDVFPALASFAFDMCIPELYLALVTGGRVVVGARHLAANGEELATLLRQTRATVVHATPTTWSLLLEAGFTGKGLKRAIGAEPLPRELYARLLEADDSLYNFYGPTETTVWSAFHHFRSPSEPVVVGRPLSNTQIYILDNHLQPVPPGVRGEIYIGGDGVTCGYLNRPELTAEKFVSDPFSDRANARLYRTGDMGSYLPDGRIEFRGRVDNQVKVRGFRIELGEIEAVLSRHTSVQECAVVAREDVPGDKRLAAYVVAAPTSGLDFTALHNWVKERLPEYMVPTAWVEMPRLPLSPNGKVDRKNLPIPEYERPELAGEYQETRTPTEEVMAAIWSEVLRIDHIGAKDDFFALGGHSLLATQVASRIRRSFQVELPLRALFEAPTVAGLAERVERMLREQHGLLAPPIVPAPRNRHLPLSFAQQRLWFLDQLEPNNSSYNVPYVVRMRGRLQLKALEETLNEIVRRHETLRTSFQTFNDQPIQLIAPELQLPLMVEDLSGLPESDRESEARWRTKEEIDKPFDLAVAPLLRARLLRMADDDHVLILNTHHAISDRWSLGVLSRELAALYEAFTGGRTSPLQELAVHYADYALWQRDFLTGDVLNKQLAYWKEQLAGAPASLDLPIDHMRPPVQSYRGAQHTVHLSEELLNGLQNLSRSHRVTLFMTLLAAFDVLLSRYSGQADIVIGTPIAGRNRAELENLIGFFVNTLVLRTDLSGDPSFIELLGRVRETAMGAYAHQDLPFEKLVEELSPDRDLSHNPVFQVMLVLQNLPAASQRMGDINATPFGAGTPNAKFDITLIASEVANRLRVSMVYSTDLFDAATIERMLAHFEVLLNGVDEHPATRISELPLLTSEEQRKLLVDWNSTAAAYPRELCLHELLQEQASQRPESIALEFEGYSLSYAELDRRSNQLAQLLRKRGVRADRLVGVCMERSLEMVVALLGILKAGGAYVPLDPAYPSDRIQYVLDDARIQLLLTQNLLLASLPSTAAEVLCLDPGWSTLQHEDAGPVAIEVKPENLAYVIYTSGSTGRPKGVQVEHRSLVNFLCSMRREPGMGADDVLVAVTTLSFDIAGLELYLPLLTGGKLVVASGDATVDGRLLMQLLEQSGATIMQATPTTWRMLLESGWEGDGKLKVLVGGEALPADLARTLATRCASVWNMYGPTETTIWSSVYKVEGKDEKLAPIGRPIANTTFYILDGNRQPAVEGAAGELYIGGEGLARGYFERDDLTVEKFVPDPFSVVPGAQLYRTGDLARYRHDGVVEFLGRIDHQVKIRGFRIELGEIETVLEQHPGVKHAVVVAREDTPGDKRLVAYFVAESANTIGAAELRCHVGKQLPDYMTPAAFVEMPRLPLTPNGKVDRKNLPAPEYQRLDAGGEYEPRTPAEEVMAGIWAEVLNLERVGVHEQFFELGGHSLLATQVVSRIRQTFRVELPLRALFEAPTVAGLSQRVEGLQREQQGVLAPPIEPVQRTAPLPLSFAQQRLWFLNRLEPNNAAYNIPHAARLKGPLQAVVLERSLNEIVRRHESLRTSFQVINDQPVQIIAANVTVPLILRDLSALPEANREEEARRLARDEAQRPFDLTVAPLMRATLLRLAEDDHVLLLNTHHSASDGWSLSLFSRELTSLYEAFAMDLPSPLAELPIQYADYAVWQREYLAGEILGKQLAYWKQQLSGAPPSLDLPTDHPRPPELTHRGSRQSVVLPKTLLDALLGLSRKEGVTLFMTLMAAFDLLLSRYSGQEDVVVGTPIAGRNRAEVEKLIGYFANTLVLRTDLSGDPTFRELLVRVRETAMGAYAHQDVPFEKLVEELKPERDLSRNPLFQAMLVLQNIPTSGQTMSTVSMTPFGSGAQSSQFDLTLFVSESPDGLRASMAYSTDLFEAVTIERMLQHFEMLLVGAVASPEERVSKLPLLTSDERTRILSEFNDTSAVYPDVCVHDLVALRTEQQPDAVALVCGMERITYRELNARANQIASYLIKRGAGPDVPIGIYAERTPALVTGILGILKAGSAYVPIDPGYPKDRLNYILEDAQAPIVLTQASLAGELAGLAGEIICLDTDWSDISREPDTNPVTHVHRGNLAYVLFTSGSTGRPKGVALEHRTPVTFIHWAQEILTARELSGVLFSTSVCFDVSMCEMFVTLSAGGKVILAANALELSSLPAKDEITLINVVPSVMAELVRAGSVPSSVETVNLAGEALPDALVEQIYATTSVRKVYNLYGPTETSYSTFTAVPRGCPATIGKPIANAQCYVLDKRLNPVPIGVPGDLYIAGDNEARGYHGDPELTNERFVPNPFSPLSGARMYRSGDVCRWLPDGNLQYFGRSDFQVKVRGYRIELGEIEATLDKHPDVGQSIASVREDQPGQKRLVAYVVLRDEGVELEASALQAHVRQSLPEFMVPSSVVILDAFPLTPNGKVDRRALPAPDMSLMVTGEKLAPRDDLEMILVRIWQKVLGIPNIGVHDNYFDLGGHSVLAVRLLAEVEKVVGRKIPLTSLFRGSTVATLAELLREGSESETEPLVTEFQTGDGVAPPIFAVAAPGVRSLGYAKLARDLGLGQPFYKLQAQGPVAKERPHTIEEIRSLAEQYIDGMRVVQPEGPYYLVAMCGGCQIAEQMILNLEARHQEVGVFVIFDTWVYENAPRRWLWQIFTYQERFRKLRNKSLREKLQWFQGALKNRIRIWTGKVKAVTPWEERYFPENFKTPRFRAPIVLFKCPEQPFFYVPDPTFGWGARSESGVEVHELQTLHHQILREPCTRIVSQVLMTRLPSSPSRSNESATASTTTDEETAVPAN